MPVVDLTEGWYSLSYAFAEPQVSGCIRLSEQDFVVRERLSFEPDGTGDHSMVQIQKTGLTTHELAQRLAKFVGIGLRDVGFAGLKDKHAVTTQWFSVPTPGKTVVDWSKWDMPQTLVLKVTRNSRKLRRGAIAGNDFSVRVCDLDGNLDELEFRGFHIQQEGVPNYFGPQRFGSRGSNLTGVQRWFEGSKKPRDRQTRGLWLSAARSFLFNRVLAQRVLESRWNTLASGDLAVLNDSRSYFFVSELDQDLSRRLLEFDIHPSGPLWGGGPLESAGETQTLEQQIADRYPILSNGLTAAGLKQERRSLRLWAKDFKIHRQDRQATVEFSLPSGAFATSVLRELFKTREA